MLGEIRHPSEFEQQHLFGRFVEKSRTSHIPREFPLAVARATIDLATPEKREELKLTSFGFQAITEHIVETPFQTPDLATYALQYATAMALFQLWDRSYRVIAPARDTYFAIERQQQSHWHDRSRDRQVELLGIITENAAAESFYRDHASQTAKDILALESAWLRENPLKRMARWRHSSPSRIELQEVRSYMENYFANPNHQARIKRLAQ